MYGPKVRVGGIVFLENTVLEYLGILELILLSKHVMGI